MPLGFEGQPPHPYDPTEPHGRDALREVVRDPLYRHVLAPAAGLILVIVGAAMIFPDRAESFVGTLQDTLVGLVSWYYVLIVAVFVGFALWMGLGRYGDIRLGSDDEKPEFSRKAWFSMLFAAGMGIGLVFWGVAEPLSHLSDPKPGVSGTPEQISQIGLAQAYVHWGIHAWAVYAVVGLGLGYAIHRKGRPVSIRWALEPLFGSRVEGRLGNIIDVAAVVGGTFGIATTLGLAVLQMSAGAERIDVADGTLALQLGIVAVVTVIAGLSVVSGLSKGLKWLSNFNMVLAGAIVMFVLIAGPTLFLLRTFVQSIGNYLTGFLVLTFNVSAFSGDEGEAWQAAWSTFMWGSWISWAPLVGIFIARISRGRTVREFVAGVLAVPAVVSFFWFAVFGGAAIYRELFADGGLVPTGGVVPEFALFDLLNGLPWSQLVSILSIALIAAFLVTSINSGAFTLAMLSHGGDPDPPSWVRLLWVVFSCAAGAALLVTGGLVPLQTAVIVMAIPFSVIMVAIAAATAQAFYQEHEALLHAQNLAASRELAEKIREAVRAEQSKARAPGPTPARLPDVPMAWPGKTPFSHRYTPPPPPPE